MASVAQMSGTEVDSPCKHMIPVRVSMDTLKKCAIEQNDMDNVLLREKMKYCVHKKELLLCTNQALFSDSGEVCMTGAYPNVLSTLGVISDAMKGFLRVLYQERYDANREWGGRAHLQNLLNFLRSERAPAEFISQVQKLPNFSFMGFSMGLGYAHPSSGDTVVTSMIGGLLTVQNGAFHVCTGDLLMWYFDFEDNQFDERGKRKPPGGNPVQLPFDAKRRKIHFEKELGNFPNTVGKQNIFLVKPTSIHDIMQYPGDLCRVFGKALSNARPYDKVDLVIGSQAMV